ncbi:unnamed protein product [Clonostachys rosea]|uniref:F-box domain-containing protein n=1 Tax=Bionectria ochroleuca TaxID=29856 RepID=A0ABY6UFY1_BIOOC|nr:unnamed protein product [Clonostachys rosea]
MATTLTIRSQHNLVRPKKLGLLHLPEEIQAIIYEYLLVESCSLWDRKHDLDCRNKVTASGQFEIPPFVHDEILVALPHLTNDQSGFKARVPCRCFKRKSLGLMRTCRAIREISAPIFWSKNIFCFRDVAKLIANLNALRPCYRELIREISFLQPECADIPALNASPNANKNTALWSAIKKCAGLRRLELPADCIKPQGVDIAQHLNDLARNMPCLETLNLSYLVGYTDSTLWLTLQSPLMCRITFVHSSRSIPLRPDWTLEDDEYLELIRTSEDDDQLFWNRSMVHKLYNDLHLNFRVHVDTHVRLRIMKLSTWELRRPIHNLYLPPDLHEHDSARRIRLPTGKMTTLRFYGLPISKVSRLEKAQKKIALDQQQKEINGLSHAQHVANKSMEAKKWRQRAVESQAESSQHQQLVLERAERRLENNKEENKEVKKQEKEAKKKVRKSMRKGDEVRQQERKRVNQ